MPHAVDNACAHARHVATLVLSHTQLLVLVAVLACACFCTICLPLLLCVCVPCVRPFSQTATPCASVHLSYVCCCSLMGLHELRMPTKDIENTYQVHWKCLPRTLKMPTEDIENVYRKLHM